MVLIVEVPDLYPYVLLSATVVPFVTSTVMGGKVMGARKLYNVQYPNLCAPKLSFSPAQCLHAHSAF